MKFGAKDMLACFFNAIDLVWEKVLFLVFCKDHKKMGDVIDKNSVFMTKTV